MPFGPDWQKFLDAMDPAKFRQRFDKEAREGLATVGRAVVREAKQLIRDKAYAPNAQRTIDGKHGSTTPLVDTNEMVNNMRFQTGKDPEGNFVTIGTNRRDDRGDNVAVKLHEGVRGRGPGGWYIPPRPFLRRPATSTNTKNVLSKAASEAAKRAMGVRA